MPSKRSDELSDIFSVYEDHQEPSLYPHSNAVSRQDSRMKNLNSQVSVGPSSLTKRNKKFGRRKEPEKSAFEKARDFAKNVPKPKQAKNADELKLQPKEILTKSP